MIKAVLFDMDGVLIDACEIHRTTFRRACAEHGIVLEDAQEVFLEGRPTRTKLMLLGVSPDRAALINQAKQRATLEAIANYPEDRPKIQLLGYLRECQIKIGVYTNAVTATAEAFLKQAGIRQYVDCVISNENVSEPKPHPEGYQNLMRILGVSPGETLIVEDSPVGIQAAQRTGAWFMQVDSPTDVTQERMAEAINLCQRTL